MACNAIPLLKYIYAKTHVAFQKTCVFKTLVIFTSHQKETAYTTIKQGNTPT